MKRIASALSALALIVATTSAVFATTAQAEPLNQRSTCRDACAAVNDPADPSNPDWVDCLIRCQNQSGVRAKPANDLLAFLKE